MSEMTKNQKDRAEWYNRAAELPEKDATKISISAKGKGVLADGFSKLAMPEDKTGKHLQLKSDRDSVGSRWRPGPGKQLHGKASPSSRESWVKTAPNKEFKAK